MQDTAGSERYHAMSRIYYRSAAGAIVCFDLTDESSFERAQFWIDELRKYEPVQTETCFYKTSNAFFLFQISLLAFRRARYICAERNGI